VRCMERSTAVVRSFSSPRLTGRSTFEKRSNPGAYVSLKGDSEYIRQNVNLAFCRFRHLIEAAIPSLRVILGV
jgi:hypothetical protein